MNKIINWYNALSVLEKKIFVYASIFIGLLILFLLCLAIVYGIKSHNLEKKIKKKDTEKKQQAKIEQAKNQAIAEKQTVEADKNLPVQQTVQNSQPPQIINNITAPNYVQPQQTPNTQQPQTYMPQQMQNFMPPQIIYVPIPQQQIMPPMYMQPPYYYPYYGVQPQMPQQIAMPQVMPQQPQPTYQQQPYQTWQNSTPVAPQPKSPNYTNVADNFDFVQPTPVQPTPTQQSQVANNNSNYAPSVDNTPKSTNVDEASSVKKSDTQPREEKPSENLNILQAYLDKIGETIYRNSDVLQRLIKKEKGTAKKGEKTFEELVRTLPIMQQAYYEEIKQHLLEKPMVTSNATANLETVSINGHVVLLFKVNNNTLEVMFDIESENGELVSVQVVEQDIANQIISLIDAIYVTLTK